MAVSVAATKFLDKRQERCLVRLYLSVHTPIVFMYTTSFSHVYDNDLKARYVHNLMCACCVHNVCPLCAQCMPIIHMYNYIYTLSLSWIHHCRPPSTRRMGAWSRDGWEMFLSVVLDQELHVLEGQKRKSRHFCPCVKAYHRNTAVLVCDVHAGQSSWLYFA